MLCFERPRFKRPQGSSAPRVAAAVVLAASLAGCAKGGDGSPITNMFPVLGSASPAPAASTGPASGFVARVECPTISTPEGTSSLRVPTNAPATSVRYQYSLGDLVRECSVENGQVAIRVGISGLVLAGPAGGAGSFNVPVRVAIRRESDEKTVASKLIRVPVSIPSGSAQAPFTVVSDPLLVPYLRAEADRDYSILVGFDESGARMGVETAAAPRRRKKS